MKPIKNRVSAITELSYYYDVYILSKAPWNNPSAWIDKLQWVQKYLPEIRYKRLILSHHKNLNKGDYLIDDKVANGVSEFEGHHMFFGRDEHKDLMAVYKSLLTAYWNRNRPNLDLESTLVDKIKENKNGEATDQLYQWHRPVFEMVIRQYNDDLYSKEHKILQSKAKEGWIGAVIRYDRERGFKLVTYIITYIRWGIIDYLAERDGKKPLPRCRIGKIDGFNISTGSDNIFTNQKQRGEE